MSKIKKKKDKKKKTIRKRPKVIERYQRLYFEPTTNRYFVLIGNKK